MRIRVGTACIINPSNIGLKTKSTLSVQVYKIHRSLFKRTRYDAVSLQNGHNLLGLTKEELIPISDKVLYGEPTVIVRYPDDTPSGFNDNDNKNIDSVLSLLKTFRSLTTKMDSGKPIDTLIKNINDAITQTEILKAKIDIYSTIYDI